MKSLKHLVGKWKGRLTFASGWISLFGLPFLFVSEAQRQLAKLGFNIPFVYLLIAALVGMCTFAYLIDKLKIIEAEVNFGTEQSEIFRGMKK